MKKLLGFLFVALLLTGCAAATATPETSPGKILQTPSAPEETQNIGYDFRKINWGMDRESVQKSESEVPTASDGEFDVYNVTIMDFPVTLLYIYTDDKVTGALYQFNQNHTNLTDYVSDYEKLKDGLKEVYGEPKTDNVVWKDDLYKDDPSDYGMAVATGGLVYSCLWERENTEIGLVLTGDNYSCTLAIRYQDINLVDAGPDTSGL